MIKQQASIFSKHIALPQDHGSWVFILSPLLIGLFAGRRSRTDLPTARFWMLVYGTIILLTLAGLVGEGFVYILYLAIPGIRVFAWHLYLVSQRAERRQASVEILATGALSLAAPAAFWIGQGEYNPLGWVLWLLTWLQSAASIVYAYLRLEQRTRPKKREQAEDVERSELWSLGKRAFQYTSFNLALTLALGWSAWLPRWIFIPYLIQWLETLWGITHPARGWKPTAIGVRQL